MSAFNLRGIQPEVMAKLKNRAYEEKLSINLLIIRLIEQGLGVRGTTKRPRHHELDTLAGTWSAKDAREFEANTRYFEQIEEDLWQ